MSFVLNRRHIKSLLSSAGRSHRFTLARALSNTTPVSNTLYPHLYRVGSATSPGFDAVRNMDIPVVGGVVIPENGGVSTFATTVPSWDASRTWRMASSALGSGLRAVNDHGSHWLIQPEEPMSLQAFVGKLQELNSQAVKDTGPSESFEDLQPDFALESDLDKGGRFIYHALAIVFHQRLAVKDWNDNDYAYIAVLARELKRGDLALSSLIWDADSGQHWTKEMAMAAQAVQVYIEYEFARAAGNEDDEMDACNDNSMLRSILGLRGPRSILAAISSRS
ncbi:hypothetical protein EXIGLDRAFT_653515 [Exidia glandulosa HHB12029]|uniref:Tse2 ADP-ribosyltransferase toxin domain-containing protein n=1 Tax=Exidia glandulosa HHB12029 TaxID=1314781 RepID=A0A165ZVQ5_EXIGL|nr:hypothetical protein EXIGLDRAFT_653515 [Exidia glandulosa HHB12029]